MNPLAFALVAYLALGGLNSAEASSDGWTAFKSQHGRKFESKQVEEMRKTIFMLNKQRVEMFNEHLSESAGYRLALNHFSDWTEDELEASRGLKLTARRMNATRNGQQVDDFLQKILDKAADPLPKEVDWREVPGRVSRVKNQGTCGSCWSFASTGVLEGQEVPSRGPRGDLIELSEQNLMDCVGEGDGCGGGIMEAAFNQVKTEGGIESEQSYPYEEMDGKCRFDKSKSVMTDDGAVVLPEGDEEILKKVVATYGPVSVGIDDNDMNFYYYDGGLYNNPKCGHNLGHAVLIVGYGTDPKQGDYWIVKNSWSEKWGENGYVRMARNSDNQCGIADYAVIAKF